MKTIIITGAGGGLGSIVTKQFLGEGYTVVAVVSGEAGKAAMPAHPQLQTEAVDLSDETASATFARRMILQHKKIDGAFLLAGGFAMGDIQSTGSADLQKMFSVNFETAYHLTRALFQHMMEQGDGRIVLIGARPALSAGDGKNMVAYGLSKSLLFTLADYINEAARGKNVTCSVVVPSTIDTPANRKSMPQADASRWVRPEQLADLLSFIVSEKGSALREPVLKLYNNS
jgi:NAD(P)-dependent dehydrogenase (short-subunit alcohol dehydrogenase family)